MTKRLMFLATLCALGLGAGAAEAHTITFTWTWPTTRVDGSSLPLSAIGGATVYDTNVPVPGQPGTPVACPVTPIPPTAATGTCTTNTLAGSTTAHSYVLVVTDNAVPPDASPASNAVSVTIPLSGPSAVSNFAAIVN